MKKLTTCLFNTHYFYLNKDYYILFYSILMCVFHQSKDLYRRCELAYPYDLRGFVGVKKQTSVGPLVFKFNIVWFVFNLVQFMRVWWRRDNTF